MRRDSACSTRLVAMATVYVRLLDEAVHVWRPVPAAPLGGGRYRLLDLDGGIPSDEQWEFLPGVAVECENRVLMDGTRDDPALVAVRKAPNSK